MYSSSKDYIPSNDNSFIYWGKVLMEYGKENHERWKVPAPETVIGAVLENFIAKHNRLLNPNHGKTEVLEKKEARKAAVKACREYVQKHLTKNQNVTVADRMLMRITIRDSVPETVQVPRGKAYVEIKAPGPLRLNLRIKYMEAVPMEDITNLHYVIHYGVFAPDGPQPETGEALSEFRVTRFKREQFTFEAHDAGKMAWFCMRLENVNGDRGPWGPMVQAEIPQ